MHKNTVCRDAAITGATKKWMGNYKVFCRCEAGILFLTQSDQAHDLQVIVANRLAQHLKNGPQKISA